MLKNLLDIGDIIQKGEEEYVVIGYNKSKILEEVSKNFYTNTTRVLYNYVINLNVEQFVKKMLEEEVYYYRREKGNIGEIEQGYSYTCCDSIYKNRYKKEDIKRDTLKLNLTGQFSISVVGLRDVIMELVDYIEKNYNPSEIKRIIDLEKEIYKEVRNQSSVQIDILIQTSRRNSIIQTYDNTHYYYYKIAYDGTILYLKKGLRDNQEKDFKDYINQCNGHLYGSNSIEVGKEAIKGTKGFLVKII